MALVVGGTGIAPALQLLREVAGLSSTAGTAGTAGRPGGGAAFGPYCRGSLLYSSRTAADVLCIDELRTLEKEAAGRIVVRHTLTDCPPPPAFSEGEEDEEEGQPVKDFDSWQAKMWAGSSSDSASDSESNSTTAAVAKEEAPVKRSTPHPASHHSWVPGRHYHFTSQWQPFNPQNGQPLQTGHGEEAGLRGRITPAMLSALLPPPPTDENQGLVKVVVCGPPSMWEDMQRALLGLGYAPSDLVELEALSALQLQEQRATGTATLEGQPSQTL